MHICVVELSVGNRRKLRERTENPLFILQRICCVIDLYVINFVSISKNIFCNNNTICKDQNIKPVNNYREIVYYKNVT